jgi:hypothetical protein
MLKRKDASVGQKSRTGWVFTSIHDLDQPPRPGGLDRLGASGDDLNAGRRPDVEKPEALDSGTGPQQIAHMDCWGLAIFHRPSALFADHR